jgi:hypothetical protein
MTLSPKDMTPVYKATIAKGTNAARWQKAILDTTLASISDFAAGRPLANEIEV